MKHIRRSVVGDEWIILIQQRLGLRAEHWCSRSEIANDSFSHTSFSQTHHITHSQFVDRVCWAQIMNDVWSWDAPLRQIADILQRQGLMVQHLVINRPRDSMLLQDKTITVIECCTASKDQNGSNHHGQKAVHIQRIERLDRGGKIPMTTLADVFSFRFDRLRQLASTSVAQRARGSVFVLKPRS